MAEGTPSLSTILDGSVPVVGNRERLEAVAITRGRPLVALAASPRVRLDSAWIPQLYDILSGLAGETFDLFLGPLGPHARVSEAERAGDSVGEAGRLTGLLADHGRYEALVPLEASPAATLMALGADRVWLGPAATLAPLLPPDAPDATARALLELLAAAPPETRPAALARWWGEYDPRTLGLAIRQRHDAMALARRCLRSGGAPPEAAAGIAAGFTAIEEPGLALGLADCRTLGLPVHPPGPGLYRSLVALHRYYARMLEVEGEMNFDQRRYAVAYDAFIDTPSERRVLLRVTRADDHGRPLRESPTVWRWVRPSGREIAIDQVMEL